MDCPSCKTQSADGVQFCPRCGEALTDHAKNITSSKKSAWPGGLALLGVLILVVVGYNYLASNRNRIVTTSTSQPKVYSDTIYTPQPRSVTIVNTAVTINAHSYLWYTFTVPPNATTATLSGHFTATGGSGNDIICYVLDEDSFVNFKNGHPARTYFNSGQVTQAGIAAAFPNAPATYHIVLDNRFSLLTPKAVQIQATLTYLQ